MEGEVRRRKWRDRGGEEREERKGRRWEGRKEREKAEDGMGRERET